MNTELEKVNQELKEAREKLLELKIKERELSEEDAMIYKGLWWDIWNKQDERADIIRNGEKTSEIVKLTHEIADDIRRLRELNMVD